MDSDSSTTFLSLKPLIESFIETISSERGYSENTCRAYMHDLKEFESFIIKSGLLGDDGSEKIVIDKIDGLVIRGYLASLAKKNKKASKTETLLNIFYGNNLTKLYRYDILDDIDGTE